MYHIRNAEPDDYEAIAAITTLIRPEPYTAAEILKADRRQWADPNWIMQRLVAVAEDGRVVGYAWAERDSWEPEGRWGVYACSHPGERGRGAGRALLEAAEQVAREHGATELIAWSLGSDDPSLEWAIRRGYTMERQRTESVLDLKSFDRTRFAGSVERVAEGGLTLAVYVGQTVPEPLLRGIYALDRITSPDIPVWDAGDNFPAWESYRKDWIEYPDPYIAALALDGEKVVGLSTVYFSPTPGKSAQVGYTAVLREYRSRGIAMALKLMTIDEAIRRGAPRMRTNNDPDNPPMLAVNVKLGFQFIPGPRKLVKQLA